MPYAIVARSFQITFYAVVLVFSLKNDNPKILRSIILTTYGVSLIQVVYSILKK